MAGHRLGEPFGGPGRGFGEPVGRGGPIQQDPFLGRLHMSEHGSREAERAVYVVGVTPFINAATELVDVAGEHPEIHREPARPVMTVVADHGNGMSARQQ
jgi:hypothetical protein